MLGNPEQGSRVCGRQQPDISVRVSYASFPLKPDSSLGVFVAMAFQKGRVGTSNVPRGFSSDGRVWSNEEA